ncbi:MAG: hypothetical protein WC859_02055 [Elusimicrobiota bacterium]|jgi:hypothetical protein
MPWIKKGLIIQPQPHLPWMRTHAMIPVAERRQGDVFRVYVSGRDEQNRSLIGYSELELKGAPRVLRYSEKPVLGLGALGCFDDNGVTPSWIVEQGRRKFLYYIGWNKGSTVRMHLFGGLAISEDGGESFQRYSEAPIIERCRVNPYLNTAPCVMEENGRWRMWYVSGTGWAHKDLPRYNIQYAESKDGMNWERNRTVCIDFADSNENALARPCVVKENGLYKMWFSHKGQAYRMGYAESTDGIRWRRMDDRAGIDVSPAGWDSQMIEYPFVFQHRGTAYMLYNGNDYGREGAGLAVYEPK